MASFREIKFHYDSVFPFFFFLGMRIGIILANINCIACWIFSSFDCSEQPIFLPAVCVNSQNLIHAFV